jgi:uncharacterized protein YbbC (DUF1343 family)
MPRPIRRVSARRTRAAVRSGLDQLRGVQVHVTDRERFPAFLCYLLLVHHARRQAPPKLLWRDPPYEFEYVKRPIDILCGTPDVRRTIEEGHSPRRLAHRWRREQQAFRRRRAPYLLY